MGGGAAAGGPGSLGREGAAQPPARRCARPPGGEKAQPFPGRRVMAAELCLAALSG